MGRIWIPILPLFCWCLENQLLLISINFTPKTSHSCLKKWYTRFSRCFENLGGGWWWFQIFFLFSPRTLWRWSNLTDAADFFQMGWFRFNSTTPWKSTTMLKNGGFLLDEEIITSTKILVKLVATNRFPKNCWPGWWTSRGFRAPTNLEKKSVAHRSGDHLIPYSTFEFIFSGILRMWAPCQKVGVGFNGFSPRPGENSVHCHALEVIALHFL